MSLFSEHIQSILSEVQRVISSVSPAEVDLMQAAILRAPRIFVAGKGRTGLQLRGFAMRLMHMGLTAYMVDDIMTPGLRAGDLLLIGSGSGRTPSLVNYAQKATQMGARVALFTSAEESPLLHAAQLIVRIPAGSPKAEGGKTSASVQPMANLFEQSLLLVLDALTIQMMAELRTTPEEMFKRHANLE